MSSPRLRAWQTAGWILGLWATALNGFVVGFGVLWFQIAGSRPDAASYRLSAGAYGAATVVLVLALPALLRRGSPRWLVRATAVVAGMFALLGLRSGVVIGRSSPPDSAWTVLDGTQAVLWAPWTWLMVLLGICAILRGVRERVTPSWTGR